MRLVPSKVMFASAFIVLAVPEPVINLLSALLLIVVDVTAANVESPLKNVVLLAVPEPNLAVGTVPDAKSDASRLVKFAPLIAGNAPDNFDAVSVDILASATVPVRLPAGILVSDAPEPLNVVAVTTPALPR